MHRSIEASVRSDCTDAILQKLSADPHVVGITVARNASVKPPGDHITIHVLNRSADNVLRIIAEQSAGGQFSIVTSELASISNPSQQKAIDRDVDEAIWEEMETGLRHNGRLTPNYMFLMVLGGIIAAIGFVSDIETQIIALVASSIIAPGLEPIAKIPLGLVLGNRDVLLTGLRATVVGYLLLTTAAALSFLFLLSLGEVTAEKFLENNFLKALKELPLRDFMLSLAAALASILMYLSYRRNVIAGPLIALVVIPAAAALGMSLAIGRWSDALLLVQRMGVDVALIVGAGIVLIWAKQKIIHKRAPLR